MIFGHRHLPIDFPFPNGSRYINLGDWIRYFTYASFDGEQLILQSYDPALDTFDHQKVKKIILYIVFGLSMRMYVCAKCGQPPADVSFYRRNLC